MAQKPRLGAKFCAGTEGGHRYNNHPQDGQSKMPASPALTTLTPSPLQIEDLVKRFGGLTAVDGISLELRSGECLGLLGPNGAGKSTLIRCIVGRVIPNAGSVSIFGD